jgi:hypothetical protein
MQPSSQFFGLVTFILFNCPTARKIAFPPEFQNLAFTIQQKPEST